MKRPARLAAMLVLAMAALAVTDPVTAGASASPSSSPTASMQAPLSTPEPCPGTPPAVKLGTTTPVLLVHGFNEGPGVFTGGSLSLADTIHGALGGQVTTAIFDYHQANTDWVTNRAIGPLLAGCITWLAQRSETQGGSGKVIIVAHSMGGLAVRCAVDPACVESGNEGPAADPKLIGLVITLGTPNLGSNPQTLGSIDDTVCTVIPPCAALLNLRNTPAAQAMVPGSSALAALPLLPASVPVDAIAGDISFTTNLFGVAYAGINLTAKDEGDLVVPVASALADARNGALHAGPGSGKTLVNCGSVPLEDLDRWLAASGALKAPAPPVTCWHNTETTNTTWQADVLADIKAAAAVLAAATSAPCTHPAITSAVTHAMSTPPMGGPGFQWSVGAYACKDGYALVDIDVVVGLPPVAVLKQAGASWKLVYGPTEDICLVPPDAQECPNHKLPLPLPVLNELETAIAHTASIPTAQSYWANTSYTVACPGLASQPFPVTVQNGSGHGTLQDNPAGFDVGAAGTGGFAVGDLTGDGQPEVAIVIGCHPSQTSPGNSTNEVQVFTAGPNGPKMLARLTPPFPGSPYPPVFGGLNPVFQIRGETLTASVQAWAPGDCHACASIHRTVSWHWNGRAFTTTAA